MQIQSKQQTLISEYINNPETLKWSNSTETLPPQWSPRLISMNQFTTTHMDPLFDVMRGIVRRKEMNGHSVDFKLILIEHSAPAFLVFDVKQEHPIIFFTDDANALQKHCKYLKAVYCALETLFDFTNEFEVTQFLPENQYLQGPLIDTQMSDISINEVVKSILILSNIIEVNDSRFFVSKPEIY